MRAQEEATVDKKELQLTGKKSEMVVAVIIPAVHPTLKNN